MPECKLCNNTYSVKRLNLGYSTCIDCGDKIAVKEAIRKSRCVAPLFNKGAYQYIGNIKEVKYIGR
jgi:ribosomal protein L37AE/L43A